MLTSERQPWKTVIDAQNMANGKLISLLSCQVYNAFDGKQTVTFRVTCFVKVWCVWLKYVMIFILFAFFSIFENI